MLEIIIVSKGSYILVAWNQIITWNAWNHSIKNKLFILDTNTGNHLTQRKLFLFDKNA